MWWLVECPDGMSCYVDEMDLGGLVIILTGHPYVFSGSFWDSRSLLEEFIRVILNRW